MTLNRFQKGGIRNHIHTPDQVVDPNTGESGSTNLSSTVLTLDEAAAPGTPTTGKAYIYVKSDGRVYSKGDDGVERGPFDQGGVDLSAFRLSGVKDSPNDLALGTYGDEFEYASNAAFDAVWTTVGGGRRYVGASAAFIDMRSGGCGITRSTSGFASDFEVAFLVSGHEANGGMVGIGVYNSSGNGNAWTPYDDGTSREWNISGYNYNTTGDNIGSTYTGWNDGRVVWWALRKNGTNWRLRYSTDGTTWTTIGTVSQTVTFDRIGFIRHHSFGGGTTQMMAIHRFVYGAPDIGLG